MIILSGKEIKKAFGTDEIIKNATFAIHEKDRIGIVGVNGAGKSTLFKIINGEIEKDGGEIYLVKNKNIGYMSQFLDFQENTTLWNEVIKVFSELILLEKRMKELEADISKVSASPDKSYLNSLMKTYSGIQHQYEAQDGFSYESKAKGVLKGLGFSSSDYSRKVSEFSGGQKTRIALAKVLLKKHDILLLDEPTNYLDIESVEWLEDFLKSYNGILVIISHDRYFLDNLTNKTFEIENGVLKEYNGNYSSYTKEKETELLQQYKDYDQQQREIARQEAIIARFRQYNREKSIKQAESREKMLQRIERIVKPDGSPKNLKFIFEANRRSGNDVLRLDNISKSYKHLLFKNFSLNIYRGEKVALLGPNGIGKTTLLKIIAGKVRPDTGDIGLGVSVIPSFYEQEQESLDIRKTIIDEIWDSNSKLNESTIRNALAAFLFKGEDVFKEISILSGGEKSRLALLKLILSKANFLLLDEPTNHLDMASREVLENALLGYTGTVLFVSHDRYFLNKVATKIVELKEDGATVYNGNYTYYLKNRRSKDVTLKDYEEKDVVKSEWTLKKEERAAQRRQQKRLKDIEEEINAIDNRIIEINTMLESPEVFSDHNKCLELNKETIGLKEKLEKLYDEWGSLSE